MSTSRRNTNLDEYLGRLTISMNFENNHELFPLEETEGSVDDNLRSWMDRWFFDLSARRLSQKTLKSYTDALIPFIEFAAENKKQITLSSIGARFVNRFLIQYQIDLAQKRNHPKATLLCL